MPIDGCEYCGRRVVQSAKVQEVVETLTSISNGDPNEVIRQTALRSLINLNRRRKARREGLDHERIQRRIPKDRPRLVEPAQA